jgi:putative acetyltransferase
MSLAVRHLGPQDHDAVHDMLTSPHVLAGTMRLPYVSIESTRARLAEERGVFRLVAVDDAIPAGFCELVTHPDAPCHRHVGELNMIVTHAAWRGHGVGRALMEAVIDLADHWLNLVRLGLIVFTDNAPAIRLYQEHGFTIEGTMPRYGYGAGVYLDAHVMGRLRPA